MELMAGNDGEYYLVFDSELEAEEYAEQHPDKKFSFHCFGGYMNALKEY